MRRTAQAVIGAGYGDEGKGLVVDALAAQAGGEAVVVRFNGGAQAGHTVTTPDGRRHVFHHLGAGALSGAATFLSRFFIVNPILFHAEADEIAGHGGNTGVVVDPKAPVTLPADMMINQIVERARGAGRHGSCGFGIGETVERGLHPELQVRAGDLGDISKLAEKLRMTREHWVESRLAALGVHDLSSQDRALLADAEIDARWLEDASHFAARVGFAQTPGPGALVFEGAQGLRLDQTRGDFPYVTRSNTGCRNAVQLGREWGVEELELIYVSRVYRTRHGAGPLPREYAAAPFPGLVDETNIPNPWQGTLRFAPLDLDALAADIAADAPGASISLAMTCLDQPRGEVEIIEGGAPVWLKPETLAERAAARVGAQRLATSQGVTRATFAWGEQRGRQCSEPVCRARAREPDA